MCPFLIKINPSCAKSSTLIVTGKTTQTKKSKTKPKTNCSVAGEEESVAKSLVKHGNQLGSCHFSPWDIVAAGNTMVAEEVRRNVQCLHVNYR